MIWAAYVAVCCLISITYDSLVLIYEMRPDSLAGFLDRSHGILIVFT